MQHKNLIQIKWADGYRGSDIERIRYRLEDKEKILCIISAGSGCRISAKTGENPVISRIFKKPDGTSKKKLWIRAYYQDLLERSENKRKKIFWN